MPSTRKRNTALREELRQQWQVIFGNHRYWFHLVIWSLVIVYCFRNYGVGGSDFNAGIRIGSNGKVSMLSMPMTITGVVVGSLMAAAMVYFFLLPVIAFARYKKRKRYLLLGVMVNALVWICTLLCAGILIGYAEKAHLPKGSGRASFVAYVAVFSLIISAYFFAIYYFIDLYDQQKNLVRFQQVFTEKLHAETAFLKTQINPHFLFNTLNNIYSLTLSKSDDAPIITTQLKDLISYMVHECAQDLVPLSGEFTFLTNYIALEKLRNKEDRTSIELTIKGDAEGKKIAPLLLINFIENAFKHGVKAGIEHSFVQVIIAVDDQQLTMQVRNSKPIVEDQQLAINNSSGIGIRNVKRRLAILYPNRHKLRVKQSVNDFNVHLTIKL